MQSVRLFGFIVITPYVGMALMYHNACQLALGKMPRIYSRSL